MAMFTTWPCFQLVYMAMFVSLSKTEVGIIIIIIIIIIIMEFFYFTF